MEQETKIKAYESAIKKCDNLSKRLSKRARSAQESLIWATVREKLSQERLHLLADAYWKEEYGRGENED